MIINLTKRRAYAAIIAASLMLSSHAANAVTANSGDATISAVAGTSRITIKTCAHDAGAICSLKWKDTEFIDDYDHGRQLQSASSFDGLGEFFNPTEAGAEVPFNGLNPSPSSSTLQAISVNGNVLSTQTKMAYWKPVAGVAQSDHILNKQVTIGKFGLPHVIEYLTQFSIPKNESHNQGVFEVLTGYMPVAFTRFFTFDVKSKAKDVTPLNDGPGEQNLPVIFSSADGGLAMGIYSPESPQTQYPALGYGRWRFSNVVKWNNVFRIANPSGTYNFRSYVIVGTLADVKTSMQQLHAQFEAPVCSSVTLTPNSLPAIGGNVSAQAHCSGSGLTYAWTVDGVAYSGNQATNSSPVGANTTSSQKTYQVCVTASNAGGKSQSCTRLTQAGATVATAPTCSSLILTPNTLPAAGGNVSAQANCSGSGLTYAWTVDGVAYSGSQATNSAPVAANTTSSQKTYKVCVTASNTGGKSQLCTPLTQAGVPVATAPACSSVILTPNNLPATGGNVSARANCSGSGLTYVWTVNGVVYSGNQATNSSPVGVNTTASPIFYAVCVKAINGLGQSSSCAQLVQAPALNLAPVCSSVTLTPSSLPATGGLVSSRANCSGNTTGLYYTWTVNGVTYPGNQSTNSSPVGPNTTATPITYSVCVVANNVDGQSQPACTPLIQAAATTVLPSAPTIENAVLVGSGVASVSFTPGALGTGSLISYTAACGGYFATGTSSPILVTGLPSGTPLFCHVKTISSAGASPWSDWSSNPIYP